MGRVSDMIIGEDEKIGNFIEICQNRLSDTLDLEYFTSEEHRKEFLDVFAEEMRKHFPRSVLLDMAREELGP